MRSDTEEEAVVKAGRYRSRMASLRSVQNPQELAPCAGTARPHCDWWHLAPRTSSEVTAASLWCPPTPLLEEERYPSFEALVTDVRYPLLAHGASVESALATSDDPIDPSEVKGRKWT
jgi:hypothetical protein